MNTHKTTIHARCPFLPVWDYYKVEFQTVKFIQCEILETACDKLRGKKLTQEQIAKRLRKVLPKDVGIKIVGRHGANCLTEVTQ